MKECIVITEPDYVRLKGLINAVQKQKSVDKRNLVVLLEELDRAERVPACEIPPDRITMNSVVDLYDPEHNQLMTIKLVFPRDANFKEGNISVLSLLGSALIGCSEGSRILYDVPVGKKEIVIRKIIDQPESRQTAQNEFILLFK